MKTLRLGGQELRCVDQMPIGRLFALAEGMTSGEEMKQVATMATTIRALVTKEDRPRLEAILNDDENVVTFDELNTALGALIVQYTQRPLGQPSASPSGRSETRGTLKVVSLSRRTVKAEPTSSKGGASRAS